MAATQLEPKVCVVLVEGVRRGSTAARSMRWPGRFRTAWRWSAGRPRAMTSRPSGPPTSSAGTASPRTAWPSCCSPGTIAYSTALGTGWRTLGATGTVTRAGSGVLHEIDGRPAIEFLARYLDVTGPASFGNPLAVVEAGGDESVPPGHPGDRPASGSVIVAGSIPVGARGPADDRRHRGHPGRHEGRPAPVRGRFPGRRASRGGPDLLLRGPAVPARVEDPGRGGTRAVGSTARRCRWPASIASARSARCGEPRRAASSTRRSRRSCSARERRARR